jgi:predicted O-methyltransferase YrrM
MPVSSISVLQSKPVTRVLDRLYKASEETDPSILSHAHEEALKEAATSDSGVAHLLGEAFMPVSPETGRFLYILARTQDSRTIVEFGTSFGISTIFLAAAVCDNGEGRVIASELNAKKVKAARRNLYEAGLGDFVEIREGDALTTLRELEGAVDLLFLDGWKDMYLPVLQLVEPHLRSGSIVIADDLDIYPEVHRPYLEYVRCPENGYVSVEVPLGDRIEVSFFL